MQENWSPCSCNPESPFPEFGLRLFLAVIAILKSMRQSYYKISVANYNDTV